MELLNWIVPAALVLVILVLLYLYGTWTFSTFSKHGIPGPSPVPFFGNMLEIQRKGFFEGIRSWRREYGKNFGVYFMRQPLLITADMDVIKEVFIKDFTNFTNRGNATAMSLTYPLSLGLAFSEGDRWRRLRHTMTPTFTTGKLKLMAPFINRCCDNLSRALLKITDKRELVDVKRVFGAFTLDVIAGTAFGFKTDMLTNENEVFLQSAIQVVRRQVSLGWRTAFFSMFPFLGRFLGYFAMTKSPAEENIISLIDQIIKERKKNDESGQVDFLQLMLEAEASETDVAANSEDRLMTKDEILAQGVTILTAGYETTATTLHYMTYLLALNPDKQEKLYNEIVTAIGNEPPTYENVMSIKYLDNTIRETLRWFPPTPMISRRAAETRTIKGLTIQAGSNVAIASSALMQDEEIFAEPHKFIPERFDDESMPTVIRELGFGMGPRQCIGMRLALYEAKMAAVTVIRKFKLIKAPGTPECIALQKTAALSTPVNPIFVRTELRK